MFVELNRDDRGYDFLAGDGKQMPKFTQVMRDLDKDKFLETSYYILSQQVHVSHSTVLSFLDWEDDTCAVKYDQQNPYEYQTVYVTAAACMLVC